METRVCKTSILANTKDRGTSGTDADDAAASEHTLDLDHSASLGRSSQLSAGGDSGACTASSSGGACGESNKLVNSCSAFLHGCAISS